MNEDGTPIESVDQAPDNTNDNVAESTTSEEVAKILHLPQAPKVEEKQDIEDTSGDEVENKPNDTEDKPAIPPVVETPDKPVDTQPTAQDAPTFELKVADANGEEFIIKPDDNLESVLENFEPKSNGQVFAILEQVRELKSQKAQYDKEQSDKIAETEKSNKMAAIQEGWEKEIQSLQGEKRLEITTDGKPSERVNKVFSYMAEENDKRIKEGRPLIQSFEDALDKLELKETKDAQAQKAKDDKELAKKRGSIVGGSSAPATNGLPVYKGGARTANEAIARMGLIK
jgi:hypothetical protein